MGERRALSGRTGIANQQLQAKTEVPLKMSSSFPWFISPWSLVLSRAKQAKLPFRAHLWQELWAPISWIKETATVLVCQLPTFCSNKRHAHSLVQYYVQGKKNNRPGEHQPGPAWGTNLSSQKSQKGQKLPSGAWYVRIHLLWQFALTINKSATGNGWSAETNQLWKKEASKC